MLAVRVSDDGEVTSHQSPPVDFPLYGLADAAWDGPRWLRFYEGALGEVPIAMHLAHGRSVDLFHDSHPWAEVRSLSRTRFSGVQHGNRDPLPDVAYYAWMSRGFGSEVNEELAQSEANAHQGWETVEWTLDGTVVQARRVPDHPDALGAWAGFGETPEVFVVVAARGFDPADVRLTRVLDGSSYGMSLEAMLDYPASIESSIAKALGSKAHG